MRILNGDHAQFEIDHANTPLKERPDWPFPSFDARDWAEAFCKVHPNVDEGSALAWFANALMRGYDQGWLEAARCETTVRNAALEEAAILLDGECARYLEAAKSQPEKALSFGTAAEALDRMGETIHAMKESEA